MLLRMVFFWMIGAYNNTVALYLENIGGIVYFRIEDMKIEEDIDLNNQLKECVANINEDSFNGRGYQEESVFYIPIVGQGYFVEIDVLKQKGKVREISDNKIYRLKTVEKEISTNEFLFTTIDNKRIIWSMEEGIKDVLEMPLSNVRGIYAATFQMDQKRYYIPLYERCIFGEIRGKIEKLNFDYPASIVFEEHVWEQYRAIFKYKGNIFFQTRVDGEFYCLDVDDDRIQRIEFDCSREDLVSIMEKIYKVRGYPSIMNENREYSLCDFINYVVGK